MCWLTFYTAALFWALLPGNLVTLPPGASRSTVNLVHAALFGVVWMLTHKMVCRALGCRYH
jgi:hypothetical protein